MKKFISSLILLFVPILISCGGNQVEPNEGYIVFHFPDEYQEFFPYAVPSYTFTFEGNINTVVNATTTNRKVFGKNDDFILSEILEDFFNSYKEKGRLTTRVIIQQEVEQTKVNSLVEENGEFRQKSYKLEVVDNIVYSEVAFVHLENGLYLSFEYRRFDTEIDGQVKTLYVWNYTHLLNAVLNYPFIIQEKENNEREFLLVSIPPNVIYRMGLSDRIPFNKYVEDDRYLGEHYRQFFYPEHNDDPRNKETLDLEKNIQIVKDFYIEYYQGRYIDDDFYFTFMERDFKVTFKDSNFIIDYHGLAE